MTKQKKLSFFTMVKGAFMGMAEVIPGVSGGTIAFITGIYERLINAIKEVDLEAINLLRRFKLMDLFKKVDGFFLLSVALGMFAGIGIGVLGIGHLLENYPAPVWGFFFGLIIASAIYIARKVDKWSSGVVLASIIGLAIALSITYLSPTEGSGNLFWVFICGCIAISALILPGVSGSFILLLLGMYTVVRGAAEKVMTEQDLGSGLILLVFMIGCGVGLLSFARVMSFAFKNYRNVTLGLLTGFMLGSLRKIWPWRNVETYLDKETGQIVSVQGSGVSLPEEIQILSESLVLPAEYAGNSFTMMTIVSLVLGFVALYSFSLLEKE